MDSVDDGYRNPKRLIPTSPGIARCVWHLDDVGLVFENASDCFHGQRPHLGNLSRRVVAFDSHCEGRTLVIFDSDAYTAAAPRMESLRTAGARDGFAAG